MVEPATEGILLHHEKPGAAEPQPNLYILQILQKATKRTKGQGHNYGSLFPLLPSVKFRDLNVLEIAEDKMHAGKHHLQI